MWHSTTGAARQAQLREMIPPSVLTIPAQEAPDLLHSHPRGKGERLISFRMLSSRNLQHWTLTQARDFTGYFTLSPAGWGINHQPPTREGPPNGAPLSPGVLQGPEITSDPPLPTKSTRSFPVSKRAQAGDPH
ncbi:hypothetical protein NDU88_003468 [Pleurodeles waltl]|uniref:Uncharacterized protein n=1 Tax=Pleurodeles waltl TaxID=8319 RepID=A0AAV7MQM4_PLEWA|nr:hypothetical protein NDU88_003468 [Pleurodeles waltl]